jgi:hypothetical protein
MLGIIECAARSAEWPLASGSRSGYLSAVTAHQSPYDFFNVAPVYFSSDRKAWSIPQRSVHLLPNLGYE